jgi:hypothetical protein
MELSPHTQVEDLASLLAVRRTQLRERALRHQAYLNLTTAVLNLPDMGHQQLAAGDQPARATWSARTG